MIWIKHIDKDNIKYPQYVVIVATIDICFTDISREQDVIVEGNIKLLGK